MKKVLAASASFLAPGLIFAAIDATWVNTAMTTVSKFIDGIIPLLIAIAVLLFIWGLIQFILASDDAEARAAARQRMIWGVIIIFVMVSLWGLVRLLDTFFGLDDNVLPGPQTPDWQNI